MTGPVLSFDINATEGRTLTRIAPDIPADAGPAPRHADATRARADVASAFAGLLGVDLRPDDFLETLAAADDLDAAAIARALNGAGLVAGVATVTPPNRTLWPALAEMQSGQVVLVLGQEGETLRVYDTSCAGHSAEVEMADFLPVFTGRLIRARVAEAELTRRHASKGKVAHWFWGEILRFRRIIGEVALGSFVANLLAVAVALFSLQVYDRVIPHQSISTLWVLAIGAGLALTMEAVLRIARARLMDGAGRRVELRIQDLLMNRLMGM